MSYKKLVRAGRRGMGEPTTNILKTDARPTQTPLAGKNGTLYS
jgi:hypothetical protein